MTKLVWKRFGNTTNLVDPFCGSLAILLQRPGGAGRYEIVNDKNCHLANFWRALQADSAEVARWADSPVNEADLNARHCWLVAQAQGKFRKRMMTDPHYYDAKIAGWWVWGLCLWIGHDWCPGDGHISKVARPSVGCDHGIQSAPGRKDLPGMLERLAKRLRHVEVCCGDWKRVLGYTPTTRLGTTAVFLDPPYSVEDRKDCYSHESRTVAHEVREWAIEHGSDRKLRIALCGYDTEHKMPDDWTCVAWKTGGGYGSMGQIQARVNRYRERIWFSPHCLEPERFRPLL